MKTVSGNVLSTKQISLAKATKLISRFAAADNEATPAFAAYLRRTRAAFEELVQLHKVCESPVKKDRTGRVLAKETQITAKRIKPELVDVDERVYIGDKLEKPREEVSIENVSNVDGVLKKSKIKKESSDGVVLEKKHKKKKSHESEKGENVHNIETEATDKKTSRKRKHENVVDGGELDGSHDAGRSKKKKIQTLG